MHLEQLEAILEVASTGSISAAAKNLSTNQPSLSRTIKAFEAELQVTLFERTSNGVILTETGRHLMPFIWQLVNDIAILQKEANQACTHTDAQDNISVRICTSPIIMDSLLSLALSEISSTYPQIHCHVQLLDNQNPNDLAVLPDYDLFIGTNIANALNESLLQLKYQRNIKIDNLFTEPFQLLMHHTHPLAAKEILSINDMLNFPLILHDNGFSSDDFYQNYLKFPKEMSILFKSNNPSTIVNTLKTTQTLFLSLDFFIANNFINQQDLCVRPVKNLQAEYFCLYPYKQAASWAIKTIISLLKFIYIKRKS